MRTVALIVAAGRGSRFGGPVPKQYLPVAGRPLLGHTIRAFASHPEVDQTRVVIYPEDRPLYDAAAAGFALLDPVDGGGDRQASVRLGLESLAAIAPKQVLIHDGARPLVTADLISRTLAGLSGCAGAIAALPLTDTVKREQDGWALSGPPRAGLWRAQTPQAFDFAAILAAHRAAAANQPLTDDAAIAEQAGLPVRLVAGSEDNLKVTNADDLDRAERLLLGRCSDVRVGTGFDVHAFAALGERQPLLLCGVEVPHDRGLVGHSDADVALHAVTDAVLGAIGSGDIGVHFPPSDPRWQGAASWRFLDDAVHRLRARGGLIAHVDLTLICERPRIGSHRAAMCERLAAILQVPAGRVSVKATTTEGLGFTGRGEGIAAQATATVRLP